MLCLLGCLVLPIEWGQVMEATCIYCTSLHTFPIDHHPSIVPLLQFWSASCEAPHFQVLEEKAWPNCHSIIFPTCMILFSPSMMYSLLYEPNDGSMILGFCVFLRFSTVCECSVMVLCDDCKMLAVIIREMGIGKLRMGCLLGQCSFMMSLCGIIRNNGAIWLWVDD
jgi:hypothetical protein